MDTPSGGGAPPNSSEGPSSVAATATHTAAAVQAEASSPAVPPSRYESQKRRDWNTFLQYLRNHKPPLTLARCSGAHVIEFLKYLDQFGKTKVHMSGCPYFGHPNPPAPCACPLKQAWGSLDALIGRLRAAYDENGGRPESNPFGAKAVRIYLREVREGQAKARGIPYEKKKRKRSNAVAATAASGGGGGGGGGDGGAPPAAVSTTGAADGGGDTGGANGGVSVSVASASATPSVTTATV